MRISVAKCWHRLLDLQLMGDHYCGSANQANPAFHPFGITKMSSDLESDVCYRVYGWHHLVKATELTAGLA